MARNVFDTDGNAANTLEEATTAGTYDGLIYNDGEGAIRFTINFDGGAAGFAVTVPGHAHRPTVSINSGHPVVLDSRESFYFTAVKSGTTAASVGAEFISKSHGNTAAAAGDAIVTVLSER